jgi:hypothetical protein
MKIKARRINSYFLIVERDGEVIGFLRKAPSSRTTTTPYQPFTANAEGQVGDMIPDASSPSGYAACYGADGKGGAMAKKDAIAILEAL